MATGAPAAHATVYGGAYGKACGASWGHGPSIGPRTLTPAQRVVHSYGGIPSAFGPPSAADKANAIAQDKDKALFGFGDQDKEKDKPLPLRFVAVAVCLVAPIALFASVGAALSFSMRVYFPALTWLGIIACASVTLACFGLAAVTVKNWCSGDVGRKPYWYVVLAFSMGLAFGLSVWLGTVNWQNNMLPYRELQHLSVQQEVNVATMPGRQSMDAGSMTFVEGTVLDVQHSIGFKNVDRYCVAPIKLGAEQEFYDYWAVGLNCCGNLGADFKCGAYANPNARAGVRLMRADQREFYELAVHQAMATYGIKTDHPIFLYWVQDPVADVEHMHLDALRYYAVGVMAFSAGQLLLVAFSAFAYTKL